MREDVSDINFHIYDFPVLSHVTCQNQAFVAEMRC